MGRGPILRTPQMNLIGISCLQRVKGLGLRAAPSLAGDECVLCFQRAGGARWTTRCGAMRELTAS